MAVLNHTKIGLLALSAILILLVITVYLYHQYQLKKEAAAYPAPGTLIAIDKHGNFL